MNKEQLQEIIDKVDRNEGLTEEESIIYFQEVLGFSKEDAQFAATQKRKKKELEASGAKVFF